MGAMMERNRYRISVEVECHPQYIADIESRIEDAIETASCHEPMFSPRNIRTELVLVVREG